MNYNSKFANDTDPEFSQKDNSQNRSSRLEFVAFCVFLATVILTPLAFWPSPYISIEMIKTFVIAFGTIVSAILFGLVAIREKRIVLPPKSLIVTSLIIIASVIISTLLSIHVGKSAFGQGFEISTASFTILLFLASLISFMTVANRLNRAIVIYVGLSVVFVVLIVLQIARMIWGADFMSFSLLNTLTSSLIGGWSGLGALALIIAILSSLAVSFLPLSKKIRIIYWVLVILSLLTAILVNDSRLWLAATITFLGLTIYLTLSKLPPAGNIFAGFIKRLNWLSLALFIVAILFLFRGNSFVGGTITKLKINHAETVLPWQLTLDVTADSIKNYPLFGVGPNNFNRAYLAYKPALVNQSQAWRLEFGHGFGLIPTAISTQGLVGFVAWLLFFVFLALIGARALKNLSQDPLKRFSVISSYATAIFLWLILVISVPPHAITYLAFIFTGIFAGTAVASGALAIKVFDPAKGSRMRKILPSIVYLLILISVVWALVYFQSTIALSYFGRGIKQLTVTVDADKADRDFAQALKYDNLDVYWQARAEATIVKSRKLAEKVSVNASATDSQTALTEIGAALNQGIAYARNAIAYDPANYYSYLSEARVAEAASDIKMANGYENAVAAYANAIRLNPNNPSTYLSLASLQAKQNKLDEALRSTGAALQVKNNYLDAVFLLSQIYAAKGDLNNAIIAARIATELNPNNALLFFQNGILEYSNKNYSAAAKALAEAVRLQSDYANAKYFLGLSLARQSDTAGATAQFQDLATTNPDNQEVALILANLKAGKSIFAEAKAPVTTAPEKRTSLPIKEKR